MNYEKAYNEALKRAQLAIKECGNNEDCITIIESIFPELKESEDERIKKAIKYCIKQGFIGCGKIENVTPDECLAWLEKQGEKSKTNTVPKSQGEDEHIIHILQNIVKGACSKYGIKWNGVETSEEDLLAWIETHKYTKEDLYKAYKCADKVQYMSGYNDAKKRIEEKLCWCQGDDDMVAAALKFAHENGRHGLWSWLKSLKQRIGVQDEQKSEGC